MTPTPNYRFLVGLRSKICGGITLMNVPKSGSNFRTSNLYTILDLSCQMYIAYYDTNSGGKERTIQSNSDDHDILIFFLTMCKILPSRLLSS